MRSHATAPTAGANRHRTTPKLIGLLAAALLGALVVGVSLASAVAPTVTIENASEVDYDSAKATGHVDPADKETLHRFEYVTHAQFEASEWAEAAWAGYELLGADAGNTEVSAQLTLKAGTTYHLRLIASNEDGKDSAVAPSTFTTEPADPPEVEINPASAVTGDSAHLSGTVNSGGSGAGEKAGTYRFSCSPSCPGIEASHNFGVEGFADGADHAIEADTEGLLPNTEYTVTLSASNAAGEVNDQTTFTTDVILPQANTAFVAPRTTTTARLNAYIVPNNYSPTTYWFEYGPADCSANPCTSAPASEDASIGATDMESHLVSQELTGLSESTTYHYRVVAENSAGTVAGVDKTFETRSAAEMVLASRGYELVNPPDKGVQHIVPTSFADGLGGREGLVNTPNGEAAAWTVAAGAPGGATGSVNPFLSTRGPNGWNTISMVGPADKQFGGGGKIFHLHSVSRDLSNFLLTANEGIGAESDSFAIVRADRSGDQEALVTLPAGDHELHIRHIDASEDLRHVYFSPNIELPQKLYDYGSGTPEEVGLMPDGSSPACGVSDFYSWFGYHWIARDGSRVFFRSQGDDCGGPANLYVRNRETEETTELPTGAFVRASRDGRKAVIITSSALTAEDSNATSDLYIWSEGGDHRCLTCDLPNAAIEPCINLCGTYSDRGPAAIQVPEDLSRVYFRSPNELVPGAPKGGGVYVAMADGSIHYAADFVLIPEILITGLPIARLTPDGRGALISSSKRLTDDEIACEGCAQVYFYDDVTRSVECISCVRGGVTKRGAVTGQGAGGSSAGGFEVSADGQTIVFVTPEKLLSSDVNGGADIYQWHNGKLGLITDGVTQFPDLSGAPIIRGISANGRDIFFTVAAPLTGFEHDGLSNLYDARIGGGFAPPSPAVHCDGDACQGQLEAPPAPLRSSSSTFSGNGNVTKGGKARCRRAKVRRRGRCVPRWARCRKQAKSKRPCAKRQASRHKRSQRYDRGGTK